MSKGTLDAVEAWTAQQKVLIQRAELMLQAMEHEQGVKQSDFDALIALLQQMQGMAESPLMQPAPELAQPSPEQPALGF